MNTISIILFFVLGILLGWVIRKKYVLKRAIDKLGVVSVCGLLFLLGVSVGSNNLIVKNLKEIGAISVLFAGSAIAGTIILTIIIDKLFFRKKTNK